MKSARKGEVTEEMKAVGRSEKISPEKIRRCIASGHVVILKNVARERVSPVGVGQGLRVKVNANVGTSPDYVSIGEEVRKAKAALKYGADTIMDLSIGGELDRVRRLLLKLQAPLGTVPVYQAGVEACEKGRIVDMDEDAIIKVIEKQAKDGADFMTVHAGITREGVKKMLEQGRITGIVSRGGSFLAAWMHRNSRENPLYENYDYILEIAREYDVTLSLGDALRAGCINDASDTAQLHELRVLSKLVKAARKENVQCIVEGPGHMPINEIEASVALQKKLCGGAPFYVLGPLVTDLAVGYDHIAGAIGGAVAAAAGADFLCYVTPAEHLALPGIDDVREGVIASKIAAHAGDIARKIDLEKDNEMARARAKLNWKKQFKLGFDERKAARLRKRALPRDEIACTMCGKFCAMKISKDIFKMKK